jgi:hypothetical protein
MLQCSKNLLHAASAKHTVRPADALRRTAFLDVSSLNFGGAAKHRHFFVLDPSAVKAESVCRMVSAGSSRCCGAQ